MPAWPEKFDEALPGFRRLADPEEGTDVGGRSRAARVGADATGEGCVVGQGAHEELLSAEPATRRRSEPNAGGRRDARRAIQRLSSCAVPVSRKLR